jgi:pectate lyase
LRFKAAKHSIWKGACVRVEGNYFDNVGNAVDNADTNGVGYVQLIDNRFGTSAYVTTPTCDLQIPYPYTLDPTDSIPSIIAAGVGTDVEENSTPQHPLKYVLDQNYPNPFNPSTILSFSVGR